MVLWRALSSVTKGFWIDVGANDPEIDSVTNAFSKAGWTGINIDPIPSVHARLVDTRPADINLCLAVGAAEENRSFFVVDSALGLSTSDPKAVDDYESLGLDTHEISVQVQRLDALWDLYVTEDVHFLKIDVEGAENEVPKGADFSRHRPWIIVVESVQPVVLDGSRPAEPGAIPLPESTHAEWEPLLTSNGYLFCLFDGLNRFYVAKEHEVTLGALLSVPQNVLDQSERWSVKKNRDEAEFALSEQDRERQKLLCQLELSRHELEASRQELSAIRATRSWRITAPLRALRRRNSS